MTESISKNEPRATVAPMRRAGHFSVVFLPLFRFLLQAVKSSFVC